MGVQRTLQELAHLLGAQLQGDPHCLISGIASLEHAREGQLSFLTNQQYRKYLDSTQASAVIVSPADVARCSVSALISDNPRLSLAKAAKLYEKGSSVLPGIHPTAVIGEGCRIPASAFIGPYVVLSNQVTVGEGAIIASGCVIGNNCHIGSHTRLNPRVTLYDNVRIGDRCLIHSGVVLGADGFGFAYQEGAWVKMPHLGSIVVGNQVEIGANTTIDRGFLENTSIGDGVIIDNLVQIGHNVSIGEHTAIAGCVAIAGSTTIGKGCLIGGGSSIAGHLQITDRVQITGTTSVNHSLNTPGAYSSGIPAKPTQLWRKNVARFHSLDALARRLRALEKVVLGTISEEEGQ